MAYSLMPQPLNSIRQRDSMAKCLFTDETLDDATRVEHTIPRAIGGRVRSKEVSSSKFNHLCGNTLDPCFSGVYVHAMRVLGPCIPTEARSASERFKLPGAEGWWQIDPKGRLVLSGNTVQYAPGGVATSAIGPSIESLKPIIKNLAFGGAQVRHEELLPPHNGVVFPERAMLHWRIEVAALKSLLLTFDHQLRHDPGRFTRSAALEPVRLFVQDVVKRDSDGEHIDRLADYSLGLQYDQDYLGLYGELREAAGLPSSPFRHTLIVSADPASRTLDAVFWAFETDPHAFRLTTQWQGPPFTYVMTNGIMLDQEASGPVSLPKSTLLGRPNNRRSRMRVRTLLSPEDREKAAAEIMERRINLYQRAVDHVERTCDALFTDQLGRLARLNDTGDHRLSSAVVAHLRTLFASRADAEANSNDFLAIVTSILCEAGDDAFTPGAPLNAAPSKGWPHWLSAYRRCLDALHQPFGLPGHMYRAGSRTEIIER